MSNKPVPTIRKQHLEKAIAEIEELEARITKESKRLKDLRNKMADLFHQGEDGTQNIELHGWQVKVTRRLGISCDKDAEAQLAEDNPELYEEIFPEKLVRPLNATEAKKRLDELEDYVTTKQGLPTVKFKRIE